MKQNLVKLLLEEYKQDLMIYELSQKGIDLSGIAVSNLPIILDIIGFPVEKSVINKPGHTDANIKQVILSKNITDSDYFCRDWLFDKYYEISKQLYRQQKISVTDDGLQTETGADETTVEFQIEEYIDWLYDEFFKLNYKN
ncbi:MAG: hypothetical protein Q7U54_04530 [Bacteroidales bacterium]|nr:hypothetical protein [Bacteroidales bacterium]